MPASMELNSNIKSVNYFLFLRKIKSEKYPQVDDTWSHVKEIPNTPLLVSLDFAFNKSASLEIFDYSRKEHIEKIYSFEETFGCT